MINEAEIWKFLEDVKDPEIPVISIIDLGIVRSVTINDNAIQVEITPTYSGCPAMDVINMDIRLKLMEHGFRKVQIKQILSPAWTTDWMSEDGKNKLTAYGIAPPNQKQQFCKEEMFQEEAVQCPRCSSFTTELLSQFGSTACKAIYTCKACSETFDYFKCH
ncbi:MAG TPA: 1,2-phenylacetyl-CoA epoxidase subunit PaaD [Flavisolibacter sp.]|nr:1,2-phenylacetyl-CoA epoxidase subunit PaaD [Flavisolibacter sp.]